MSGVEGDTRVAAAAARWRCDPAVPGFESTGALTSEHHILGREDAVEALRFGLENRIRGNKCLCSVVSHHLSGITTHQWQANLAAGGEMEESGQG